MRDKTPYPDWSNPYIPHWTGNEWIVEFVSKRGAQEGCEVMAEPDGPRLYCAPQPGGNGWYVGRVEDLPEVSR